MRAHDDVTRSTNSSRRTFLKSTMVGAAAVAATHWLRPPTVHAAGNSEVRIGMIGCGGRCSGAADQALSLGPDVKLVGMSDVFEKRVQDKRKLFQESTRRSFWRTMTPAHSG